MLPEMLEPAVCVKKKTTLQHFSSLTSLTSFPNTHGVLSKCRVVVSESLALPRELRLFLFSFFFFISLPLLDRGSVAER